MVVEAVLAVAAALAVVAALVAEVDFVLAKLMVYTLWPTTKMLSGTVRMASLTSRIVSQAWSLIQAAAVVTGHKFQVLKLLQKPDAFFSSSETHDGTLRNKKFAR